MRYGVIELMVADGQIVVADSVHDSYDGFAFRQTSHGVALRKIAAADNSHIRCMLAFCVTLTGKACVSLNGTVCIVLVQNNDWLLALATCQCYNQQ